jgi:two-component system, NarL family, sensor histidine kinase UhpB
MRRAWQKKAQGGKAISVQPASTLATLTASPPRRRALHRLWRERPVRTQLLLAVVLIDIIAVGVAGSIAIVRARVQTGVEMTASVRLAELLVGDAVNLVRQELPAEKFLGGLPAQLQSLRHVRIAVRDASGQSVAEASAAETSGGRASDLRSPAPRWFAALVAPPVESYVVPVRVNGRDIGQVEISGEPADEIAEFWDNLVALGTMGVLLNVAMIGFLYVVFGRVLDPLTGLANGLSKLEQQSYNVRLAKPQARELAAITDHFNALALTLATARAENLRLNRRLITAQDDERRRTALELHDEVGPCLFGLKANASSIAGAIGDLPDKARHTARQRLGDMLGIIDHLQTINRTMLDRLRPMALGHVPLEELLGQLVGERSRAHADILFSFTARGLQRSYGDSTDLTIYRCVQESLTNAARHAQARRVTVALVDTATQLELTIRDDGRGIAPDASPGFGLRGMQERVEGLGGRYHLQSGPDGGTSIGIGLPLIEGVERGNDRSSGHKT